MTPDLRRSLRKPARLQKAPDHGRSQYRVSATSSSGWRSSSRQQPAHLALPPPPSLPSAGVTIAFIVQLLLLCRTLAFLSSLRKVKSSSVVYARPCLSQPDRVAQRPSLTFIVQIPCDLCRRHDPGDRDQLGLWAACFGRPLDRGLARRAPGQGPRLDDPILSEVSVSRSCLSPTCREPRLALTKEEGV